MIDLKAYLRAKRRRVDAALDRLLPPARQAPRSLHKAMRYMVFSGGKRLRPALCMAACEAAGGRERAALLPAAAVELLHTYTLIHDDLPCMDDDDWRRGQPTCHRVFGEAQAVLAGDALQALAFAALVRAEVPRRYGPRALLAELGRAAGSAGVVGGQVEDIAAAGGGLTRSKLRRIHLHKTADLFRAAVRMGAMAGGATPQALKALTAYAVSLGLAFQIVDDLLDANPAGRRRGGRRKRRELSCLDVLTPVEAAREARRLTLRALRALAPLDPRRIGPLSALARELLSRVL